MDASDGSAEESVMIALLPTTQNVDWCQIELPHMTLVYAGEKKDLKETDFNDIAKDAADLATLSGQLYLRVLGVEIFGDTEKVNVLKLMPTPELWAMRRAVEKWNASEFPFRPHCTIGPATSFVENVPRYVSFDRVYVGWGDESLTFWFNKR